MSADPIGYLRVIWIAMVAGVVSYTVLIYTLLTLGHLGFGILPASVLNVAAAVVLVYMGAGVMIRRRLVARIPPDAPLEARIGSYRIATLIGLGLAESGGLIVITLGMLGSAPSWVLTGGCAGLVLMFMSRPNAEEIGAE